MFAVKAKERDKPQPIDYGVGYESAAPQWRDDPVSSNSNRTNTHAVLYKYIFIFFMYMGISPACVSVHTTTQCLRRPEEGGGSLREFSWLWVASRVPETKPGSMEKQTLLLTTEPPLQSQLADFGCRFEVNTLLVMIQLEHSMKTLPSGWQGEPSWIIFKIRSWPNHSTYLSVKGE